MKYRFIMKKQDGENYVVEVTISNEGIIIWNDVLEVKYIEGMVLTNNTYINNKLENASLRRDMIFKLKQYIIDISNNDSLE